MHNKVEGSEEVGMMVWMESDILDKHIIKLECCFHSSPVQSENEKMPLVEHGLLLPLLLLPLNDVPDPGHHKGHPDDDHNPEEQSKQVRGQKGWNYQNLKHRIPTLERVCRIRLLGQVPT